MTSNHPAARWCTNACKSAGWKAEHGYAVLGVRKACQTRKTRAPRPSDVRITRQAIVDELEEHFISRGEEMPFTLARALVHAAMTPAARKRAAALGL